VSDVVTLRFPARGEHLVLARLVTSALASRAGMDLEEIDDLRLAVDELCLSVMTELEGAEITLRLLQEGRSVSIDCHFQPPAGVEAAGDPASASYGDLSLRILDALVDDHGRAEDGESRSAWLRKMAAAQ